MLVIYVKFLHKIQPVAWKDPAIAARTHQIADGLIAYCRRCKTRVTSAFRNRGGPQGGPRVVAEVRIDSSDVTLPHDLLRFTAELPEDFSYSIDVWTKADGPTVVRARWVPLQIASDPYDVDPKTDKPLNAFPQACAKCGHLNWDQPPTPYRLHRSILAKQAQRDHILEASNGMILVRPDALEILRCYTNGEFMEGSVRVENSGATHPDLYWVRPTRTIGERYDVGTVGESCPSCGRFERYAFTMPMTAFCLVNDFGDPAWNIAREGEHGTWVHEDVKRERAPYFSLVVSGGLFRILWNARVKGLQWPDYVMVSLNAAQPVLEETVRFHDVGARKQDRALTQPGPDRTYSGFEHAVNEIDCGRAMSSAVMRDRAMPMITDLIGAVAKHVEGHIGPVTNVLHELIPTSDLHIDVHVIAPTASRPFYTLVTSGMSEKAMKGPRGLSPKDACPYVELALSLPAEWRLDQLNDPRWNWPVFWLRFLATYPHQCRTWLYVSHTIPNSETADPFSEDTDLCCWFVRFCGTVPESFHELKYRKRTVLFLGLTAIYRSEMDFALSGGIETKQELDQALTEAGVTELLDLKRPPVRY